MSAAIHQLTAGFTPGDAISNEAVALRRIFRSWGRPSEIFSDLKRVSRARLHEVRDVHEAASACRPADVVLLHLSTGSPVNQLFATLPCRRAIIYHNITPPDFFTGIQARTYGSQADGLEQARQLAGCAEVNLAVSDFNARELAALGYRNVRVMPLVLDLGILRGRADRGALADYDDGLVNILFVGRCARNKKLEDALAAFHFFQRYVQPASRFLHVGPYGVADPYYASLLVLARQLHLRNVVFAGAVRQEVLNAAYQAAHLFLCMSEHEGFCIPLIESMVHDLPVLAYRAAAVPETLDGAGVLFDRKEFDQVAEMMGRLTADQTLRRAVIEGQRERLRRYEARDLAGEIRAHLDPLLVP